MEIKVAYRTTDRGSDGSTLRQPPQIYCVLRPTQPPPLSWTGND